MAHHDGMRRKEYLAFGSEKDFETSFGKDADQLIGVMNQRGLYRVINSEEKTLADNGGVIVSIEFTDFTKSS